MAKKTISNPTHRANWRIDSLQGVVLEEGDLIAVLEGVDVDNLVAGGALSIIPKAQTAAIVKDIPSDTSADTTSEGAEGAGA